MTQSDYKIISYDDLYQKYENSKLLLRELTTAFQGSFESLKAVITLHASEQNNEFVVALSSALEQSGTSIGALLTDTDLFRPTRLEMQISEFQNEKSKGLEMVKNLQVNIESLKEEKRNWLLQKQKGQKLIEEYKMQLDALQNGKTMTKEEEEVAAVTTHVDHERNPHLMQQK